MAYEVLVLDIDGTLTNSKKEVSPKTLDAVIRAQEEGIKVVIASGRPTAGIKKIAKTIKLDEYGGYILSYNGAKIINFQTGEVVYNETLPEEMIPSIYEEAVDNNAGIITYEGNDAIAGNGIDKYNEIEARINGIGLREVEDFPNYVKFPVNKCLLTGEPEHMAEVEQKMKDRFGNFLNIYRSEPFFVEVMPQNIDKAYSLGKLLKHLDLDRSQMIACGDGFNDLSMIKYAGLGVAMSNAQDVVKEAADYVTLSNDEDGVAKVIDKFMLNA
jgi:Cof subfamily protein (haloacid dehalogenase superfamily)